jgi:hypothetical protein
MRLADHRDDFGTTHREPTWLVIVPLNAKDESISTMACVQYSSQLSIVAQERIRLVDDQCWVPPLDGAVNRCR